ncbi:MAG TPA: hypothetical protein PK711_06755 [Bacteroidales bacterium]|nr:hypothetical protein [Bacteroidales bacterium]HRZ20717.1 hypothetical protein [Bacteroidales bacterium]
MKNWVRIMASFELAVLYCFAVIYYSSISATLNPSIAGNIPADTGGCMLVAPPDLIATEAQVASFIKSFEKLPFAAQKNYLDRFVACIRTAELYMVNTFSRYIYHAHYEVDRFEQPDIIFPFQYFW